MDNNAIFAEFWRTYQWPDPEPVLFRLYHDAAGFPLAYSQEDLPGAFVDVTPDQYVRADFCVRVVNGAIVPQEPPPAPRLVRASHGVRCHVQDVTVITDQTPYQTWSMKHDEN